MASNNSINNSIKVTEYTSDDTWVKDPRALRIELILCGAGSGGGSGRRGAAGTNRYGGSGGSAGGFLHDFYPADKFADSEAVIVGTAGVGGAAQTSDDTDGNNGTAGEVSSVGSISTGGVHLSGYFLYGLGGLNATTAGGSAAFGHPGCRTSSNPAFLAEVGQSAKGANGNNLNGSQGYHLIGSGSGGGGSGGGGVNTSNTAGIGRAGGNVYDNEFNVIVAGGATNGGNGANAAGTEIQYVGGGGGGSGDGNAAGAGVDGGNGGFPGGGGGGGGGCVNGNLSGAGGDGANGKVIIIEYFL